LKSETLETKGCGKRPTPLQFVSTPSLRGGPDLIELPTKVLPVRKVQVHRHDEARFVRLQLVIQCMGEDLFETLGRRLRVVTLHLFAPACNPLWR
jgi:hypothetical protein